MDINYAAGFFDGEGSIYANLSSQNQPRVGISVAQRRPEVLHEWNDFWGFGFLHQQESWWRWDISGNVQCQVVIAKLLPYLIVKKEVATVALELLQRASLRMGRPGRSLTEEERSTRLDLMDQIQRLNVGYRQC